MNKEELKALGLTDEQVAAIVESNGKTFVSKGRFNEINEENKSLKAQLAELNTTIDTLKKDSKGNEETVKQLDALKAELKTRQSEHEAQMKALKIDGMVERSLLQAKARNTKAVRALLNLDNAEIDGLKAYQDGIIWFDSARDVQKRQAVADMQAAFEKAQTEFFDTICEFYSEDFTEWMCADAQKQAETQEGQL